MQEVYIMRHGIAEDYAASGRDQDRKLTSEGIEHTSLSAKGLKALGVSLDLILTSPFRRALQTAEIVHKELQASEFRIESALASGEPLEYQLAALRPLQAPSILLAGHEPDLSRLVSSLISGSYNASVTMKKGAICKLRCSRLSPGGGCLEWLLSPKILTRIR